MNFKADIGIIGALEDEVREIISRLEKRTTETVGGIEYNTAKQNKKGYLADTLFRFGRDDKTRTCGIHVPNVARYHLRYISIFYCNFI